jgi:hypothetical protein
VRIEEDPRRQARENDPDYLSKICPFSCAVATGRLLSTKIARAVAASNAMNRWRAEGKGWLYLGNRIYDLPSTPPGLIERGLG